MIRRHPSPDLLASYAAGDVALAAGLSLSAHLEMCPACRLQVTGYEDAEGAALQASPNTPLNIDALARTLARLDDAIPAEPAPHLTKLGDVELPAAVACLGLASRRWIAPGFWSARVRAPETSGWRTYLLRAPAGTRIPQHAHGGEEYICVLSGELADESPNRRGDFSQHDAGTEHVLTVGADAPCACLVSVRGTTRWRGWSQVVGPYLGM